MSEELLLSVPSQRAEPRVVPYMKTDVQKSYLHALLEEN